jgi:ligand-binding sensor domain-containing protein/two-component sensor histidine kinase
LLLICVCGRSQEYSYRQFTTADGLPSNVVNGAFQDSKGFIWFYTDAGVSRFNGISFRNFTVENGLSDNEVFGAFETSPGRIWFRSLSNTLTYYENDSFHSRKNTPWLRSNYAGLRLTYVDTVSRLCWTRNYIDTLVYILDEKARRIRTIPYRYRDSVIIVASEGVDTISIHQQLLIDRGIDSIIKLSKPVIDAVPDITSYFMHICRHLHAFHKQHRGIQLSYLYQIFIGRMPASRFKFNQVTYSDRDGYTIMHANKGILRGKDFFNEDERPETYLPQRNISSFMVDKEGNYWFTSPTEGVFLLTAHGVKTYESGQEAAETYSVTGKGEYVVCGKDNQVKFIHKVTGKTFTWQYNLLPNSSTYNRIKDILIDDAGNCWLASDIGAVCIRFSSAGAERIFPVTPLSEKEAVFAGAMKCLARGSNNRIYLGSHANLYLGDGQTIRQLGYKRTTAVTEISKDRLLVGSTDGLHTYSNNQFVKYRLRDSSTIDQYVTDLEKDKAGIIYAATNGIGLIMLRDGQAFAINATDSAPGKSLPSNICRKLFIDEAGHIWVSTNKGLCRVTVLTWDPFVYEVRPITTDDGLISNDVNDVYVSGDTVWVATSAGLSFFRQDYIEQEGEFPLIFINLPDNQTFNYRSTINIGLEGISYESLGKVRYRYRVKGLNSAWQYTDRHLLTYELLPPGQYELEVYSINRFGQESLEPRRVVFTVVPPWWRTNWAYALYLTGGISLLAFAFLLVRRMSRQKERNKMKHVQQLQQLELKALRSQMNPHFIFNTLNAVQKYILENDKEASYRYLTRFSKLIRGFLENSRQTTISLQHELDLLRAYMEMEALRFRNKFDYEIRIDPNLDAAAVYIPSMLIQPYVENAIWHGIQHKEANGFVKLSVEDQGNNVLKCTIEDNGIGRQKAGEISPVNGHQPVGMTITQQRLELINQRLKHAVSVNFIDVAETPRGGSGTIVELVITYLTKNHDIKGRHNR